MNIVTCCHCKFVHDYNSRINKKCPKCHNDMYQLGDHIIKPKVIIEPVPGSKYNLIIDILESGEYLIGLYHGDYCPVTRAIFSDMELGKQEILSRINKYMNV